MKRYIRTKDNKIYDTTNYEQGIEQLQNLHPTEELDSFLNKEDIVIESDNIFDLLQVGDLVSSAKNYVWQIRNNYTLECESLLDDIIEIYTKQGDNFVLVWTKEEGII